MTSLALAPDSSYYVRSVLIADIPNLLQLLPADGGHAWVRGTADNHTGIVGWGTTARAEFTGAERFSRAQRWWSNWCEQTSGDSALAFASFAFAAEPGLSVVVVPQICVQRTDGKTTITVVAHKNDLDHLLREALARIEKITPEQIPVESITWLPGTQSVEAWQESVEQAIERINSGELDKVVLARDIVAQLDIPLHVGALLQRLNSEFPDCWAFSVDGLVGATPELLIRRGGKQVTSRVLAGTVRRSSNLGRDDALAASLLDSGKDQEEHEYAVRSVQSALAQHCTDLVVPDAPFILQLANVQHLATDITGELAENVSALALAASLHPTAAVCGTPTERALGAINDLEVIERGRYSGPVGWFTHNGDGEFGIALRCAAIEGTNRTQLRLYAGCGIVAGSTSELEIAESNAKFNAMRSALI
ncbi:MAG: isochorismate synthase [Actinomycetes bacterium]